MPPVISLGGVLLSTPRLAFIIAIISGWFLSRWVARRHRADSQSLYRAAELLILALIIGARLGFVAENWSAYQASPWSVLYVWETGYDAQFGLIGAIVFFSIYALVSRPRAVILAKGFALPLLAFLAFTTLLPTWQQAGQLRAGDQVPSVVMNNLQGALVSLPGATRQPTVVNIWATWCLPCRKEIPLLNQASTEFAKQHVKLIGLNLSEPASTIRRFVANQPIAYPVWVDPPGTSSQASPSSSLFQRAGALAVPTTLFIGCDGLISNVVVGQLSPGTLYDNIKRTLC